MSKRPSDAVSDMLAIKAARTDRSAQVSPVAAATKDTGSQTDSTVATQIHELRMALLKIKAAFVPQKAHGKRDGQSEEAFDELEAERDSLLDQMDEGAEELVPEALRILDDLELACCIPRRRKVRKIGRINDFLSVFTLYVGSAYLPLGRGHAPHQISKGKKSGEGGGLRRKF